MTQSYILYHPRCFNLLKQIFLAVGGWVGGGGGGWWVGVVMEKWVVPYTGKIFPVKRVRGAYISLNKIRFSID